MKFEDICTRKEFESNGQKKVTWLKCGTMRTNDKGHRFIELNHLPGVIYFVFERKEKEQAAPTTEEIWLNEEKKE